MHFAVIYLSKFSNAYDLQHFKCAKRVLRYLGSTKDMRLTFHRALDTVPTSFSMLSPVVIEIMSDSDWASDSLDRKSVSGCLVFVFGSLVSWMSKKQVTVALSSCEAEYYAIADGMKEGMHVENLLSEMGEVMKPTNHYIDNIGAGYMSQNAINNKRTKHIDIRYHFISITSEKVDLSYNM